MSLIDNHFTSDKAKKQLMESLKELKAEIQSLKATLNKVTISKQYLINELHETKFSYVKLLEKFDRQRDSITEENDLLRMEMEHVKASLRKMQRSLHLSNRKLTRHMHKCAGTRFRLGEMFLRMRSTKRRQERRRMHYQQLCFQFATYVREQNRYMMAAVEGKLSTESITTCHRQYLGLLTRCSQLLHENMNLRLLAMNQIDEGEDEAGQDSAGESTNKDAIGSEDTLFKKYIRKPTKQRRHSK